MIKFIHTADIHYGVENYGRIDSKTGIHSRLLDFHKALNFCIDTALEEEVDFFLFSGDAYKTTNPSPTQQKLLMESFFRLYSKNIPIIIIIGNHDNPLSFGKATSLDVFNNLPVDGFHVITKPQTIHLETKNGPVNVVGIPWPTRNNVTLAEEHKYKSSTHITEYLAQAVGNIIAQMAAKLDPTVPAVLGSHLTVSSGIFSGSEKRAIYGNDPCLLPSQLAIEPFDYIALGHLHRYQDLNKDGYPSVVYSGSPERVDFGERKEDKGFCLVSIPEKGKATHKFIKTPTRAFIQIEVKLSTDEELDQTEQVVTEIQKYEIKDAVLKIVYHVPSNLKNKVDLKAVQQACDGAMFVVGVIPVCKPVTREKRGNLSVDMKLETLLDLYFEEKPALKAHKKELIKKALELAEQDK